MDMTPFSLALLHVPHIAQPLADLRGLVVLYVGPDQMLPVMSALGAVIGVLLMVWNRVVALVRRGFRAVMRRPIESDSSAAVQKSQTVEPPEGQS